MCTSLKGSAQLYVVSGSREAGRRTGETMELGIFLCFVYIKKTKILKPGWKPSGTDFMPIISLQLVRAFVILITLWESRQEMTVSHWKLGFPRKTFHWD